MALVHSQDNRGLIASAYPSSGIQWLRHRTPWYKRGSLTVKAN